jgi:hypothetical protein
MASKMLTAWLPVDPERVRAKLARYGTASPAYIEDCEKDLALQGYRFNPRQLTKLKAATEKYCALWDEVTKGLGLERVGPPQGKVAPPEAAEYLSRGLCLVTEAADDPSLEPRSRH